MVYQQNPAVGWNQLYVDELRANGNVKRSLPYYGEVLSKSTASSTAGSVHQKETVHTISKLSKLKAMLRGSAASTPSSSQHPTRQSSAIDVNRSASTSSSASSLASVVVQHPVVKGSYLPMFRVAENAARRRY